MLLRLCARRGENIHHVRRFPPQVPDDHDLVILHTPIVDEDEVVLAALTHGRLTGVDLRNLDLRPQWGYPAAFVLPAGQPPVSESSSS